MRHMILVALIAVASLSTALAQSGKALSLRLDETFWRLAVTDHVPLGLERVDGSVLLGELTITGDIERDLDSLVSLMDDYRWRKVNGVYAVRPATAWSNPDDELNQHTPPVDWRDIEIRRATSEMAKLFYGELFGGEAPQTKTHRFSVSQPSSTFLHVLNAVAQQHGALVWIVRSIPPAPPSQLRVGIELRDFDGTRADFVGVAPKRLWH